MSATASLTRDIKILAGVFVTSGVVHLVRPETYEPIMPLLHPRTRKLAGWASLGVLLTVYPANLKMAGDALKTDDQRFKAVALARLPLQLPMIRAALRAARAA